MQRLFEPGEGPGRAESMTQFRHSLCSPSSLVGATIVAPAAIQTVAAKAWDNTSFAVLTQCISAWPPLGSCPAEMRRDDACITHCMCSASQRARGQGTSSLLCEKRTLFMLYCCADWNCAKEMPTPSSSPRHPTCAGPSGQANPGELHVMVRVRLCRSLRCSGDESTAASLSSTLSHADSCAP